MVSTTNEDIIAHLRDRLKLLLSLKNMSMVAVSRAAGVDENSLKEFMSGKKNNTNITTVIGWACALDTPITVLLEGFNPVDEEGFDDFDTPNTGAEGYSDNILMSHEGFSSRGEVYTDQPIHDDVSAQNSRTIDDEDERILRRKAGKNLRFIRCALGKSHMDFAIIAQNTEEGEGEISLIYDYEQGAILVPPLAVVRLSRAFGFSVNDIYR
jgi:transcriptional regulator with XRE-family HTH domain